MIETNSIEYEPFICEPIVEAGKDIDESMQCTRTGSIQSLNASNMVFYSNFF